MPFEPHNRSITEKRPLKKPSFDRVHIAVCITVVAMVLCAVAISLYTDKYVPKNQYYPTGTAKEVDVYEDGERFGGFTVIGEPIDVLEFTDSVERGDWATVCIQGRPNTEYDITVYLKSGPSANSSLVPKRSNEYGVVKWEWRVSSGTTPGDFKIVIKSMQDENICITYAEMYINVTSDEEQEKTEA